MATFRKHGRGWQARVRRGGYPDEVKTFPSKADAERWARAIEGDMDRGEFVSRTEAEQTTFGEIIQRYIETITPKKRGHVEETVRLKATLRHRIAKLSMANLTPQEVADYRDGRLLVCKANTVIRDLAVISSIINHARREWGIVIQNPVEMIPKPMMPPGRDRVLSQAEEGRLVHELAPTGRRKPNIITMFKNGSTKIPMNRIGPLAKALAVDPAHLLRLAMSEYLPDTWDAIEDIMQSTVLTANELKLVRAYREVTGDSDAEATVINRDAVIAIVAA